MKSLQRPIDKNGELELPGGWGISLRPAGAATYPLTVRPDRDPGRELTIYDGALHRFSERARMFLVRGGTPNDVWTSTVLEHEAEGFSPDGAGALGAAFDPVSGSVKTSPAGGSQPVVVEGKDDGGDAFPLKVGIDNALLVAGRDDVNRVMPLAVSNSDSSLKVGGVYAGGTKALNLDNLGNLNVNINAYQSNEGKLSSGMPVAPLNSGGVRLNGPTAGENDGANTYSMATSPARKKSSVGAGFFSLRLDDDLNVLTAPASDGANPKQLLVDAAGALLTSRAPSRVLIGTMPVLSNPDGSKVYTSGGIDVGGYKKVLVVVDGPPVAGDVVNVYAIPTDTAEVGIAIGPELMVQVPNLGKGSILYQPGSTPTDPATEKTHVVTSENWGFILRFAAETVAPAGVQKQVTVTVYGFTE